MAVGVPACFIVAPSTLHKKLEDFRVVLVAAIVRVLNKVVRPFLALLPFRGGVIIVLLYV